MATDFTGYNADTVLFGWALEAFTVKRRQADGRGEDDIATNVPAKANREEDGIRSDDAVGAMAGDVRTVYFGCTYYNSVGTPLDFKALLQLHDWLVDDDGTWWMVDRISNPGGADEHLEVKVYRVPSE